MKKILPLLLIVLGVAGGSVAGIFLRPSNLEDDNNPTVEPKTETETETETGLNKEYVKLNNQFVIPLVENGNVTALVVMSLSVEVESGQRELVFAHEPKLRDSFLQVIFDHASVGGFRGEFTRNENLSVLRRSLRGVARRDLGEVVSDVLILEIARQDY